MTSGTNTRLLEGALSALKTPTKPPSQPRLVPLTPPGTKTPSEKEK